jgi:hypothetical protein
MEAFDWIKRLYQDGDSSARMDTIKYATIIGALTHAKKPERAQEVLLEMVNDHYKNGNSKAKPDAKAFHSVLACWARPNGRPTMAVQQADNLLRRLWSLFEDSNLSGNADNNLRPSTWTYNTVRPSLAGVDVAFIVEQGASLFSHHASFRWSCSGYLLPQER